MREVELKSVVDDLATRRELVELAGAKLIYEGPLEDLRYDTADRALARRGEVLRVRIYGGGSPDAETFLDWKGKTEIHDGYKSREEISSRVGDATAIRSILENVGYVVTREICRSIAQYEVEGAVVRFEQYPLMDALVEVEGGTAAIERAIRATGLSRSGFSADRLPDFIRRFEKRTGKLAALCERELRGEYPYDSDDAG
jgi:predicted adenylyl cyclase CyaB